MASRLDSTPYYFEVENGKTEPLKITNKALSGILIHKTDSTTGEGIYGVTFLLYDSSNTPSVSTPVMTGAMSTSKIWRQAATTCASWKMRGMSGHPEENRLREVW